MFQAVEIVTTGKEPALNNRGEHSMRMFKVTACVPSQTRIRTQRELQNTFFTKLVPYDNWFREQQRIQKMGGKIVKVELATGKPGANAGLG